MNFADLNLLRVAAYSPQVSIGNCAKNAEHILSMTEDLHRSHVSIAVFPELSVSGYTAEDLFFSSTLLQQAQDALVHLVNNNPLPMLMVGLPWQLTDGRLLNCAAVIAGQKLLGLVPKSVHPNYGEFYDQRWFVPGGDIKEVHLHPELGQIDIRTDQLFDLNGVKIGVEVCEDLWAPIAPGTYACLAGANVIANLSASNELIAKADYRRDLVRMASAKNICGYIYANAGPSESTKDVVFGGHCMIFENGTCLEESDRFSLQPTAAITDLDIDKLGHDRAQNTSFAQAPRPASFKLQRAEITQAHLPDIQRRMDKQPFVPDDEHEFSARAQEILSIQATGLARRMLAAHAQNLVIGLSGGLDSTLAYLVCLDALKIHGLPFKHLRAITMPGPGTTGKTLQNAQRLATAAQAPLEEISIAAAVEQHLSDLNHAGDHDIVFENAQARERTQILFNYANKVGGIVVGTGDLSELALGWCTFNADQMASYNVNASVPKTLIAYLVRWYAAHRAQPDLAEVLLDVLDTPISPELLPPKEDEISQRTEDIVGPYELHDFFLYHFLRNGSDPKKIYYYAKLAFAGQFQPDEIKHWLQTFLKRFFSQQFKRTTLPPGPKVGSVSLSPRGDWRMPDEASVEGLLKSLESVA